MTTRIESVDAYIATFPEDVRARLQEIRRRIHQVVPDAGETIKYNMPTITLDGRSLVHFAAWKQHIALYPIPTADDAFEHDIAPYRGDKDAAKFPSREPVPYELIERLVGILVEQRASADG